MAKNIFVGTQACKKIYVGTQEVKKIFVGTNQVWPNTRPNETGYWNFTELVKNFGGNHFYFVIYFAVLEKDYNNNRMRVKYEVGMGSNDGYHISASTNRTGSGSIDGQNYSWTGNATIPARGYKMLYRNEGIWINNASGRTISMSASHPLEVNVSGVGHIGTVSVNGNVKLPTL